MIPNKANTDQLNKVRQTLEAIANFKYVLSGFTSAKTDLNVGAIARCICLIVAWVNQVLAMIGTYELPALTEAQTYVISSLVTISITVWSYWKNNSISDEAKVSDAILKLLRDTGIDSSELLAAIDGVVSDIQSKKTEEVSSIIGEHVNETSNDP